MRRGSLCERRMKCGQGACACQHDPKAAHGPYFLLTHKVEGKTRSRYVSPEQAPVVRRQIESWRQFRERVEAYWEACERWADEQLEAIPVSAEEAKKRGLSADLESETLLGPQALAELDFEAAETFARRQALRLAARALEQRLNADTSDYVGLELPCPLRLKSQSALGLPAEHCRWLGRQRDQSRSAGFRRAQSGKPWSNDRRESGAGSQRTSSPFRSCRNTSWFRSRWPDPNGRQRGGHCRVCRVNCGSVGLGRRAASYPTDLPSKWNFHLAKR